MLSALGANELGFLFGSMPGPQSFHRACLFLGLVEWTFTPIFKPYQKHSYISLVVMKIEGFVIMYKVIILTVEGQCTNCTRGVQACIFHWI